MSNIQSIPEGDQPIRAQATMNEEILGHLSEPAYLEKLYRLNKHSFKESFEKIYPQQQGNILVESWNERLKYDGEELNWGSSRDLLLLIAASLLAGLIAKLPSYLPIDQTEFYLRDLGFVFMPILTAYFAWKNRLPKSRILFLAAMTLIAATFINLLPINAKSDTLMLSCLHLGLFLWSLLGIAYTGQNVFNYSKRLDFLRFNGEWIIMTGLILIAGGIMTAFTFGLFSLIGVDIEWFYVNYVLVFGLASAPIVSTYLVNSNPQLVNKVSPAIARIFSPLVLIMLVVYLIAIIVTGKNPYRDREFLLMFNVLLMAVMAIIFFSIAESANRARNWMVISVLLGLSLVTVVVNGIALSAILFRISEWGFTPNRTAVMGGNLLILGNLILVTIQLIKVASRKAELESVGRTISLYLPIYSIWTVIVTFIFPIIFGFK